MNPPAGIYYVDEHTGQLSYELTYRPVPFTTAFPFRSASFFPSISPATAPSPVGMNASGVEPKVFAASFLDLGRQIPGAEGRPEVSDLPHDHRTEQKVECWVDEEDWFAQGDVYADTDLPTDLPRCFSLVEMSPESTPSPADVKEDAESRAEVVAFEVVELEELEEVPTEEVTTRSYESVRGSKTSKRELQPTTGRQDRPRTRAYTRLMKAQQERLAQGVAMVKTALNDFASTRVRRARLAMTSRS